MSYKKNSLGVWLPVLNAIMNTWLWWCVCSSVVKYQPRRDVMRLKYLLLIFSFFCCSLQAQQTDWKKLQDELTTRVRSPDFVIKFLDETKLVGMPRRVVQEHFTELYKSDDVLTYLINEMRSAGFDKSNSKNAYVDGRKFGSELFSSLAMKGLNRLSTSEQRRFISFLNQFMNYASPEDCKHLLVNGSSTTALEGVDIEIKYYNKFKEEELRNYFYTLRQAIYAEIRDYPDARVLNQNQIKIADDALLIEFENKFKKNNISESVLLAFQDMHTSAPKDVCEVGKISINAILDLKGFAGDLAVAKFISSIK